MTLIARGPPETHRVPIVVDAHAPDQPMADLVPVLDGVLGDHVPRAVTHDLTNRHNHLTIGALLYVLRLDKAGHAGILVVESAQSHRP